MANYVAVPAEALEGFLQSQKFERTVQGNEVVYFRRSTKNPNVRLKVYTSVRVGQAQVRNSGKDSIKVCAVFDNDQGRSFGVGKFNPVFRVTSVESVLARLKERILEAAKRANEWIAQEASRPKPWERGRPALPPPPSAPMVLPDDFQDPCSEPPPAMFEGE